MDLQNEAGIQSPESDEWSRVGVYLDKLAFENDRLEIDLKKSRERRLARTQDEAKYIEKAQHNFNESRETVLYETSAAISTAESMHVSYDALKNDLSGLMGELAEFKSKCAGLESRFLAARA
ncbi:MAG: hypothetical protein LDLANPLL_01703 [Turneriella sp.]|nr:hypothetical protein [Turneriella sp.]